MNAKVIQMKSSQKVFNIHLALDLHQKGKLDEASNIYESIIKSKFQPKINVSDALNLLGTIKYQKKEFKKAADLLQKSLLINKWNPATHSNLGSAQQALNRFDLSINSFLNAITIDPSFPEYFYNIANSFLEIKSYSEALKYYDFALFINSNHSQAYSNKGVVLQNIDEYRKAVKNFDFAIINNPTNTEAYSNKANIFSELRCYSEAISAYELAIFINPDHADSHHNLANLLSTLGRTEEALTHFKNAFTLNPKAEYIQGNLLHCKLKLCIWNDFDFLCKEIETGIINGEKTAKGLSLLATIDNLQIQKLSAEKYMHHKFPIDNSLGSIPKIPRERKIRIGYFSPDFNEHPVAYLTAELYERHNKDQFEVIGFYFGPETNSRIHHRIKYSFDKFINVNHLSDKEIASLSRSMNIMIAIDLAGTTGDCRPKIFSYRAAPIQLSYIGYLGTMGSKSYEYVIADQTIIPEEYQKYYSEKIIYLPNYQVNDSQRKIADTIFKRSEFNLPENAFVFCCFNNNYKIIPSTFDGWMRILHAVPKSSLLLYSSNKLAEQNLRAEAELRGISSNRLQFCSSIERSEYLARFKIADLFLDTLPYNAGTTASDALWAGLPVLTCVGMSFASRIAASVLRSLNLTELITNSQEEYEALAIELATNPRKVNLIKEKLAQNRFTNPLFNSTLFTHNLETAYEEIYRRYDEGATLEHITV